MAGENGAMPQPMDVIEKLREAVRPLNCEIHGFEINGDSIELKLGQVLDSDWNWWMEKGRFPSSLP